MFIFYLLIILFVYYIWFQIKDIKKIKNLERNKGGGMFLRRATRPSTAHPAQPIAPNQGIVCDNREKLDTYKGNVILWNEKANQAMQKCENHLSESANQSIGGSRKRNSRRRNSRKRNSRKRNSRRRNSRRRNSCRRKYHR